MHLVSNFKFLVAVVAGSAVWCVFFKVADPLLVLIIADGALCDFQKVIEHVLKAFTNFNSQAVLGAAEEALHLDVHVDCLLHVDS